MPIRTPGTPEMPTVPIELHRIRELAHGCVDARMGSGSGDDVRAPHRGSRIRRVHARPRRDRAPALGICHRHPHRRTNGPAMAREGLARRDIDGGRDVERRVRPAIIVGNGLGNGARYFDAAAPSSTLLDGVHGGMAERGSALRWRSWTGTHPSGIGGSTFRCSRAQGGTGRRSSSSPRRGRLDRGRRRIDGTGTRSRPSCWGWRVRRSSTSRTRRARIHSCGIPGGSDIGKPIGSYQAVDGVYRRRFARGLVLVNPTDGPVEARLRVRSGRWTGGASTAA